jgi:hypothetical protein
MNDMINMYFNKDYICLYKLYDRLFLIFCLPLFQFIYDSFPFQNKIRLDIVLYVCILYIFTAYFGQNKKKKTNNIYIIFVYYCIRYVCKSLRIATHLTGRPE